MNEEKLLQNILDIWKFLFICLCALTALNQIDDLLHTGFDINFVNILWLITTILIHTVKLVAFNFIVVTAVKLSMLYLFGESKEEGNE
jgi:hypothetical protein